MRKDFVSIEMEHEQSLNLSEKKSLTFKIIYRFFYYFIFPIQGHGLFCVRSFVHSFVCFFIEHYAYEMPQRWHSPNHQCQNRHSPLTNDTMMAQSTSPTWRHSPHLNARMTAKSKLSMPEKRHSPNHQCQNDGTVQIINARKTAQSESSMPESRHSPNHGFRGVVINRSDHIVRDRHI